MFTSDIYTIKYSKAELEFKAAAQIFAAILLGLIAFLSAKDPIGSTLWVSIALVIAFFACLNLHKLIFQTQKAILVIAPEGIKDIRLGPDFIPWAAIEKIDVHGPRLSAATLFLGFGLIMVAALFLTDGGVYAGSGDGGQPKHHIWLLIAPGQRVAGQMRGFTRSIKNVNTDTQQVCIATSNLTHGKQRILDLLRGFHARYATVANAENVA
ncbi:hypothetical protein [Rhizobium sp. NPDC090279]|uniref:hypothetical protein n=1 Tax=Rhizobium sp. NPDC090279 TaxID=3364499 RepID=UPI00383A0AF9